jgi:thiol-disulfide isomerase/thioredoxin
MSTSAVFGLTMPSFPDKKEQRLESPPQRSYRDENSKITLVSSTQNLPPISSASTHTHALLLEQVHSPQEFQDLLRANGDKLVVLMAKAKGCRPCRAFAKNYHAAAEHYVDSVFVEVFGDETPDTRAMMKEMQVRVTPTFVMYRNVEKMHSHGGINQFSLCNPRAAQGKRSWVWPVGTPHRRGRQREGIYSLNRSVIDNNFHEYSYENALYFISLRQYTFNFFMNMTMWFGEIL